VASVCVVVVPLHARERAALAVVDAKDRIFFQLPGYSPSVTPPSLVDLPGAKMVTDAGAVGYVGVYELVCYHDILQRASLSSPKIQRPKAPRTVK
jgi:hypothetical protein